MSRLRTSLSPFTVLDRWKRATVSENRRYCCDIADLPVKLLDCRQTIRPSSIDELLEADIAFEEERLNNGSWTHSDKAGHCFCDILKTAGTTLVL